MNNTEGSKTMKFMHIVTARNAIAAAEFLGDTEAASYCPTGLSNAGSTQIEAMIAAAIAAGMEIE